MPDVPAPLFAPNDAIDCAKRFVLACGILAEAGRAVFAVAAFAQDAIDNQALLAKGKLTMPVLAIGGDHSYGAHLAEEVGFAAVNVRGAIITNSGHWIMEEQPQQAIELIVPFVEETN